MKPINAFALILIVVSVFEIGHCIKLSGKTQAKILDAILDPARYDARIVPSGSNATTGESEAVKVITNFLVRNIEKIDDVKMQFAVQLTFRQQWKDDRLSFDDENGKLRYLILTDPSKLWIPDTFFRNERKGHFHDIIRPNTLIRIYPNGNVLYSIRISLTLSCPMNVRYYPADVQTCSISIASYGYTTDDLIYLWKEVDPVQVTKNLALPHFVLKEYSTKYCTSKTNTGEYSCLQADFVFCRKINYSLIMVYIPCTMLVLVSWISFWIDPMKYHTSRTLVTLVTLLVMASMISFINASQPQVSYTKAIDVWTGVTLTFVFGALIEFALINYLANKRGNGGYDQVSSGLDGEEGGKQTGHSKFYHKIEKTDLDALSRIGFPVAFVVFVAIYSLWLFASR